MAVDKITNLKTLFAFVANTILSDSDIISFCQTKLGVNAPQIKIGQDPDDLPPAPEGALIFLLPGARALTRGESYRAHNISIVGIVKALHLEESPSVSNDNYSVGENQEQEEQEEESENEQNNNDNDNDNNDGGENNEIDENIETLEAVDLVDTLMDLIEKAIFTALQTKGVAITSQMGDSDEINYPYGRGVLAYTVEIPVRI